MRCRSATLWYLAALGLLAAPAAAAPSVASINLCADQLLLTLADRAQILSLSWLATDPQESLLADQARDYPLNYGSAEELLEIDADVILAGTYTALPTRAILKRLGYRVVEIAPANSIADIERNVSEVAAAIDQAERGRSVVAQMRRRLESMDSARQRPPTGAAVLRPGLFTVDRHSLAHELMERAGLRNLAAIDGTDRWGTLSLESLLTLAPALLIIDDYRSEDASLANSALDHPALHDYAARATVVRVPGPAWSCGLPKSLDTIASLQQAARAAAP
jgi:iron complex transport system substrate-binding protein